MNEFLRLSEIFRDSINRMVEPIYDLRKKYSQAIKITSELGVNFKNLLKSNEFIESMNRLKKGLIETEEDLRLFKTIIVDLGYPPNENMDIGTIRGIAQAYREDSQSVLDNIDDFMCQYYDYELITEISLTWENNKLIKRRLPILRNVIMAHNQGMYNVAVPTMISQLEGVIVDAFEIKGKVTNPIIYILLKELLKIEDDSIYNFDSEIYSYYDKYILVQFERGKDIGSSISRHAILHGEDVNYGYEANSIKTILLFEYLVSKLSFIDNETKRMVKIKVKRHRDRINKRK